MSTNKYPARLKVRNNELAMIHIAKQQLGMDDDTYRDMLWTVARVRSSAGLDWQGRKKVLDHLKARGFKVTASKTKPQSRALADDPQSKKIRELWLVLHSSGKVKNPSEAALAAFVKRLTGVEALQWLTSAQASTVIEALKKWLAR